MVISYQYISMNINRPINYIVLILYDSINTAIISAIAKCYFCVPSSLVNMVNLITKFSSNRKYLGM